MHQVKREDMGAWQCTKAWGGAGHHGGNSGNQHAQTWLEVDGTAQPNGNRSLVGSSEQPVVQGQRTRKSPVVHIMFVCLLGWFLAHTMIYRIVIHC